MSIQLLHGDCLAILPSLASDSVQCAVTSPPYWGLRDYHAAGQLGHEATPEAYVAHLQAVFAEVRRVLRPDGTLWLVLGDSYSSAYFGRQSRGKPDAAVVGAPLTPESARLKPKDLVGIPWRVAFALQADGWWLRQDIIWEKVNPMPESVKDRCTQAHEYIFLLAKAERYYYDRAAIAQPSVTPLGAAKPNPYGKQTQQGGKSSQRLGPGNPNGRNRRDVWTFATQPCRAAHFATFPPALVDLCILAGSRPGDTVLDPFSGAGTTGLVADRLKRDYIGIELNAEYLEMSRARLEAANK